MRQLFLVRWYPAPAATVFVAVFGVQDPMPPKLPTRYGSSTERESHSDFGAVVPSSTNRSRTIVDSAKDVQTTSNFFRARGHGDLYFPGAAPRTR